MVDDLNEKVSEYAEKHDLDHVEEDQLFMELWDDLQIYGNCYLDMEEGRIKPTQASTSKGDGVNILQPCKQVDTPTQSGQTPLVFAEEIKELLRNPPRLFDLMPKYYTTTDGRQVALTSGSSEPEEVELKPEKKASVQTIELEHTDDEEAMFYEALGKVMQENAEGLAKLEREEGGLNGKN